VALAKLYAIALNKRLSDWTKKYLCRAKAQAGFHKDYRCAENLFILWTLLEKSKSQRTKFCCYFVGFLKHLIPYPEPDFGGFWKGWGFMEICSMPSSQSTTRRKHE
jgi:hypothetical protein